MSSNLRNSLSPTPKFSTLHDYINHINYLTKSIVDAINMINTLINDDEKPTKKEENLTL